MHTVLWQVFDELDRTGVAYCLLRDADRLDELARGGEVDLLVESGQLAELHHLLRRLGFARLPDRGYAPHHFFIIYDRASDGWLKLDVTTKIAFGKPVKNLGTDLATNCLRNRRRLGAVYAPMPEDEFVALLLHCVLDKGRLEPHRQLRLQALRHQIADEAYVTSLLRAYWSPMATWPDLAGRIDGANWTSLLAERPQVIRHLRRRQPVRARARVVRARLLRQLNRWDAWRRPAVPTVALLGPDGVGKSTLAHGIQGASYFPTSQVYMGLYQKGSKPPARRLPGIGFAHLLLTQWKRYLSARYRQTRGHLVIFDRYSYDALLPTQQRPGRFQRARRWLLAHACPPPDLVLVLDAPAETLFARKGEHTVDALDRQRASYRELQTRLPQAALLDTTGGADQVRRTATDLIWQIYVQRHSKE